MNQARSYKFSNIACHRLRTRVNANALNSDTMLATRHSLALRKKMQEQGSGEIRRNEQVTWPRLRVPERHCRRSSLPATGPSLPRRPRSVRNHIALRRASAEQSGDLLLRHSSAGSTRISVTTTEVSICGIACNQLRPRQVLCMFGISVSWAGIA